MVGDNMNIHALLHRSKSEYAYAYDESRVHLTLRTARNDLKEVKLIYGDPFEWNKNGWVYKKEKMVKRYQTSDFDYYFAEVSLVDLRVKYIFSLKDNNGNFSLYGAKRLVTNPTIEDTFNLSNYFNYPYINYEDLHHSPKWIKDTTWYQIFPDRFYASDPKLSFDTYPVRNNQIFGGNLKGIMEKIPYLKDLGITGIYFTPIFEARTAHKYDTIDYFKIDPSFGTNEDFKMLVEECHKNDIKIMLDGVFNHCGFLHPYFLDVIKNNENSVYKNSFHILDYPVLNFPLDENGEPKLKDELGNHYLNEDNKLNYRTFAYTPFMPKWNTDDIYTKIHLNEVIRYWLEEYNIDGWRLDVSNEISHDFLREIKKTARKANPDSFILGENWDQSLPWLLGDQMDSVMNYDLAYPIWEYFEHKIDLQTFKDIINTYLALTPKNIINNMFNLIDSHDTVRILRRLKDNKDRVKLAYLFMFLSAGAPNIYYGGEIGLTGNHDPDNRRPMIWDKDKQDLELFDFIKKLITLRNNYEVFKLSDYNFIDGDVLAFTKEIDGKTLLVVINNSTDSINFNLNENLSDTYLNLFTNKTMFYDKISLDKYKFVLLYKE